MDTPIATSSWTRGRIFHPTDFLAESEKAFIHALKFAVVGRAELTLMHIDPAVSQEDYEDFPRVRPVLIRWGLLPEGSPKEQVHVLGIQVKKIRVVADNPTVAIVQHLDKHPTDLVVLSAHQPEGVARWLNHAVAEPVARESQTKALFVPSHVRGFVSPSNGAVTLRRILIPLAQTPNPQPAIDAATSIATALGAAEVSFQLVQVGDQKSVDWIPKPQREGWSWSLTTGGGNVVDWILGVGEEYDVDLIVMMTEGHKGILDQLIGSTTERVLRSARCPLLAITA